MMYKDSLVMYSKLALITATYNENSKLESWSDRFEPIRNWVDLHIIVDDGSDKSYSSRLKAKFPDSIILKNRENIGQIASHNRGFRYALEKGAEYIGVMAPDFLIPAETIRSLLKILAREPEIHGVSAVLIKPGTLDQVESFGGKLLSRRATIRSYNVGKNWSEDWKGLTKVDTLPGGFHILKREVLLKVGLQNPTLFMYGDEIDFGIRAKRAGLNFAILRSERVWHEHVDIGNTSRSPMAPYLVSRNRMLIMKQNGSRLDFMYLALARLALTPIAIIDYYRAERSLRCAAGYALGLIHGIIGKTGRPPEYIMR